VASVINAVRKGPNWPNSLVIWTYDEHGGFYDHVTPPAAVAPDAIPPGLCADRSDPPNSETPGNGAQCDDSAPETKALCALTLPGEACAAFNEYGCPSALCRDLTVFKTRHASHAIGDHGSILALIEKRFFTRQHLTDRDANTLALT
jgi:hypothetical protein